MFQIRASRVIIATRMLLCCVLYTPPAFSASTDFHMELNEIAPGVYGREGLQQDASAENRGHIANLGFIVGNTAVAVVDTGGSLAEGEALVRAIRRVTELPVRYVILTHMHPDHVLGAAAFEGEGVEIIGHANLADALARRRVFYLDAVRQQLGELAQGSNIVFPTVSVQPEAIRKIDLGGRVIDVQGHPTAHTNNDLSVYDPATGTLWLSDLLFVERVPVLDGSLLGWLKVMDSLRSREASRVVPGHGRVSTDWSADLAKQRDYWQAVTDGVRAKLRARETLQSAVASVAQEQREHWLLFDEYHGRNVTAAFVELEWE